MLECSKIDRLQFKCFHYKSSYWAFKQETLIISFLVSYTSCEKRKKRQKTINIVLTLLTLDCGSFSRRQKEKKILN